MKIEQLIAQYLYSNGKVTLQDIGTFTIAAGDMSIFTENEKEPVLPAGAIVFEFDPRAGVDEGLVNYIIAHTRKIRPLATSDLESFIMLNRQFLNIGKPLVIEGIGTLQKTQGGEYAFTQAGTAHVMHEDLPKAVTEKQKEDVSFATPHRERSNGGSKAALWTILLILLAGTGIAVWYFMHKNAKETTANTPAVFDSAQTTATDSSAAMKKMNDSIANMQRGQSTKDTNSFYVVIREYPDHIAAQKAYDRFVSFGNKVVLTMKDSSHYKLRMPFTRMLADTLHIKDSLSKFFSAKAYIELP